MQKTEGWYGFRRSTPPRMDNQIDRESGLPGCLQAHQSLLYNLTAVASPGDKIIIPVDWLSDMHFCDQMSASRITGNGCKTNYNRKLSLLSWQWIFYLLHLIVQSRQTGGQVNDLTNRKCLQYQCHYLGGSHAIHPADLSTRKTGPWTQTRQDAQL